MTPSVQGLFSWLPGGQCCLLKSAAWLRRWAAGAAGTKSRDAVSGATVLMGAEGDGNGGHFIKRIVLSYQVRTRGTVTEPRYALSCGCDTHSGDT